MTRTDNIMMQTRVARTLPQGIPAGGYAACRSTRQIDHGLGPIDVVESLYVHNPYPVPVAGDTDVEVCELGLGWFFLAERCQDRA